MASRAKKSAQRIIVPPQTMGGVLRPSVPEQVQPQPPIPRWLRIGLSIILLGLAGGIIVFITHKKPNLSDVNTVKSMIGKHYLLPVNDQPELATVTDSRKIQSSFKAAIENGDKVLIYQKTKQAIVYRPSIHKVVDVEPVNVANSSSATSATSPSTAIPNINPFGSSN